MDLMHNRHKLEARLSVLSLTFKINYSRLTNTVLAIFAIQNNFTGYWDLVLDNMVAHKF